MTMTPHSPPREPEHSNDEGIPAPAAEQDVRTVTEVGALIDQTAHDLRSSLNAIQSWAYVLERAIDQTAAPARRALDGVRAGIQQQLALVEEMEEAVRLLADESHPQWRRIDLLAATRQAVTDRRQAATARGVDLKDVQARDTQDARETPGARSWFIDATPCGWGRCCAICSCIASGARSPVDRSLYTCTRSRTMCGCALPRAHRWTRPAAPAGWRCCPTSSGGARLRPDNRRGSPVPCC